MSVDSSKNRRRESLQQKPVDGRSLKRLIEASLAWLRTNQQIVNSLNVFPVPDGDTGTNMVLTMQAAFDEINGTTGTKLWQAGARRRSRRSYGCPRQLRRHPFPALARLCQGGR